MIIRQELFWVRVQIDTVALYPKLGYSVPIKLGLASLGKAGKTYP
jgi:hypothetical protein